MTTAIRITIAVASLEEVQAVFNVIKVYRSTTGIAGIYTEVTTPTTRLTLENGVFAYRYTDTAGDPDYYYRSSYYNSGSTLESSLSDPQQGEGDSALDVISVAELKSTFLTGVDLTDGEGNEFLDTMYEHYIKAAVSWVEARLDMPLRPTGIVEEKHDFYKEDYDKYIFLEVDKFPVISVEEIKLVLPGNQVVQTFANDWIHVQKESGQIQIVPGTGSAGTILLGASGAWIPFIYGINKFIPEAFWVTYTAGFECGKLPYLLKDLVGKVASYGPLYMAGELLLGAGIASSNASIDGLSQSVSTLGSPGQGGAYVGRIKAYQAEIEKSIPDLIRYYKGLRLQVV
jgi:hypothetical protein